MKVYVEALIQVPDDVPIKRHDDMGKLKVRMVNRPHPRNVEAGINPIGATVDVSGSFDASSTIAALQEVAFFFGTIPWLGDESLLEVFVERAR